jgi:hypothetical protein
MAAIVAPAGDCSMVMTRNCFEPGLAFLPLASTAFGCEGFAATAAALDPADRFLADFDMEILRSVDSGVAPHHRSPAQAMQPAGQDLRAFVAPKRGHYRSNHGRMPVLSG